MPELEQYFHYRNLDVSSVKELAKRWRPEIMSGSKKMLRIWPWMISVIQLLN